MNTAVAHGSAAKVGRDRRGTSRHAFRVRPKGHRQVASLVELHVEGNRHRMIFDLQRLVPRPSPTRSASGEPKREQEGNRPECGSKRSGKSPETGGYLRLFSPRRGVQVDTPQQEHARTHHDQTQRVPHRGMNNGFPLRLIEPATLSGSALLLQATISKMSTRAKRTEIMQGPCRSRCRRVSGFRSGRAPGAARCTCGCTLSWQPVHSRSRFGGRGCDGCVRGTTLRRGPRSSRIRPPSGAVAKW